ncbi:MAG: nucleotidyltransferase family protein [Methanosarcinales archaeon Met12]|nr:MAG: nucleotidyltransferase family protein [Methanosarcinales archaeon Met12]
MKTLKEIKKILSTNRRELRDKYGVKELYIFGSLVTDEQTEGSDVDILVEFYDAPDLLKFIEIERYIEEIIGVKVDLVRKTVIRPEIKDAVLEEAIPI